MSAETWALSWSQPWDLALDRLQDDLDRVEAQLSGGSLTVAPEPFLPDLTTPLPEHLGDRARGLLARTDALAHRVAGELSRTGRELRKVTERAPEGGAPGSRGHRHPAFLDTRA